jgi:hypothetical protein
LGCPNILGNPPVFVISNPSTRFHFPQLCRFILWKIYTRQKIIYFTTFTQIRTYITCEKRKKVKKSSGSFAIFWTLNSEGEIFGKFCVVHFFK